MIVPSPALLICMSLLVGVVAAVRGTWSPCGLSMITSINPMSERARGHRYGLTAWWFVVGSTVGGLLLGAGAAASGALLGVLPGHAAIAPLAVVACLLSAADDAGLLPWRLPTHPRQVNEQWLTRYRRWVYAAGFGLQIGIGLATYIMTAATYLTVVLAALATAVTGSAVAAVGVGLVFGAVRGSAVLLGARADDPHRLARLHERLDRAEPWSLRTAIVAALIAAGGVAFAAFGPLGGMIVAVLIVVGVVRAAHRPSQGGAGTWTSDREGEPVSRTG